jgi:HAD superfamily hydrolase (TIGR01509 family)
MLVIYDCDGVLVDSEPLACRVDAEVLTELGFATSADEVMQRHVGKSTKDMIAAIEQQHGRALPADIGERLHGAILQRFQTDLRAIDGVRHAILGIPGPRCVASSSTPERIAFSLSVTGLDDLFDRRFSAVEVACGKPAPDLFLHAAARCGTLPRDCIVIEDSLPGVAAGRNAGMRVIGFAGGGHCGPGHAERLQAAGADAVISRMAELPVLLRTLSASGVLP